MPSKADASILLHHSERRDNTISFTWVGDRYQHHIQLGDAMLVPQHETCQWFLPKFPSVERLSIDTVDVRQIASGVGFAGANHWTIVNADL